MASAFLTIDFELKGQIEEFKALLARINAEIAALGAVLNAVEDSRRDSSKMAVEDDGNPVEDAPENPLKIPVEDARREPRTEAE